MNVIKILPELVIFLVISTILTSCNYSKKNHITSDKQAIVSLLINKSYRSYFRTPKSNNQKIDTTRFLIENNFIILVDSILNSDIKEINSIKYFKNFHDEFKECQTTESSKIILLKDLNVYDRILLKSDIKKFEEWVENNRMRKKYNLYLSFSNLAYNEKKDKAIVWMFEMQGENDSTYDICFLKKDNGNWKLIGFQNISIS